MGEEDGQREILNRWEYDGKMLAVLAFNVAVVGFCAAVLGGAIPLRLFRGLLRGLHNTTGITTPTDRQLRWVLVAWVGSMAVIVDVVAALLGYLLKSS